MVEGTARGGSSLPYKEERRRRKKENGELRPFVGQKKGMAYEPYPTRYSVLDDGLRLPRIFYWVFGV